MPEDHEYQVPASATVAAVLAAVAGFVDAHLFLHVAHVFVANMSGNLIRMGIDVGAADLRAVLLSLVALVAFCTGVVVAAVDEDRRRRTGVRLTPSRLLVAESVLIGAVLGVVWGFDVRAIALRPLTYLAIALGAVAMGIQAVALQRVGRVAVSTTYASGTMVRIGERIALALLRGTRRSERALHAQIGVLTVVVGGYVAGGCASALGASPWLLLAPIGVLLAVAIVARRPVAGDPSGPGTSG